MKKMMLLALCIFCIGSAWAQDAYEGMTKFNKKEVNAVSIEMNYPADVVESALKAKMKKLDLKGKGEGDFEYYKAIQFKDISEKTQDLYTKVSKKEKDKTKSYITILVSMGNDNFIDSKADATTIENTKRFLQNFKTEVESYVLANKIKEQQEVIVKDEKKLKDLESDLASYEKNIVELQKKIEQNKKDQEAQKATIEESKKTLVTFEEQLGKIKK